jgi:hypothetical protein
MRIRDTYLEKSLGLDDSGTKTFNIDVTDPITQLFLRFGATNGATYNKASPIARCISKIEVVDGSDVLWSLNGRMAAGLWGGLNGRHPGEYLTESGSDTPVECFPLNFGRHLYDPIYALNPRAFANPQLKITWNLATVNSVSATGFSTGTLDVSIIARCMEDAPDPSGLLMTKEVYDFTSLASGDTRVDMPSDYPWRLLMLMIYENEVDLRANITNVKLSCNGDKFIPFNEDSYNFIARIMAEMPEVTLAACLCGSDATHSDDWIGLSTSGTVIAKADGVITGADYFWLGGVKPRITTHAGVAMSDQNFWVHDKGIALFNTILVPFGRLDLPEEAFPAPSYENVRLFLTNGNAGADVRVGVQQYRPY